MDLDTRLTIPQQVMSRLVGEETVILDLASGTYFGLDGVGKIIWDAVSDGQSLGEAVDTIVAQFDVDPAKASNDVMQFAQSLVERGLLSE